MTFKKGESGNPTGRKKGSKAKKTLIRQKQEAMMNQRIFRNVKPLLNAQLQLAQGVSFLYKIHTNKKGIRSKPELITSRLEIEEYLDGKYENDKEDYYFISTDKPDGRAIDSLLDRVFGRATTRSEIKSEIDALFVDFEDLSDEELDKRLTNFHARLKGIKSGISKTDDGKGKKDKNEST